MLVQCNPKERQKEKTEKTVLGPEELEGNRPNPHDVFWDSTKDMEPINLVKTALLLSWLSTLQVALSLKSLPMIDKTSECLLLRLFLYSGRM